jgi:LacI family transcriptional regulator
VNEQKTATRWTIYDIAREAGVSAKTVSQVLNNKAGVGEQTRARILEIVERVGFRPNVGARHLRGQRGPNCVGITLPAPLEVVPFSEAFLFWIFGKLSQIFGSQGVHICFDMDTFQIGFHEDYARGLWEQLYRACVIGGPLALDDPIIRRVHEWGEPYIVFGRLDSMPECSSAAVDYETGAYLSTKFLADRGHKRIAMLRAFSGYQPGEERLRGYQRALEEAGVEFDERLMPPVTFAATHISDWVYRLLADPTVTALVDSSGAEDASSLRDGARKAGRVPGQDFEVVPWTYNDNTAVLREACAQLWIPARESAGEGLEELGKWFRGERDEPIRVLYRPILHKKVPELEIPKPRRLFETFDQNRFRIPSSDH